MSINVSSSLSELNSREDELYFLSRIQTRAKKDDSKHFVSGGVSPGSTFFVDNPKVSNLEFGTLE